MEKCKWYETNMKFGVVELSCNITNEETSCCGDISRCECEQLCQDELKAEAIDFKADADRENSC